DVVIVTLDTNIVVNGCDSTNLDHKTVLLFIRSFSHELALDHEQTIEKEYKRNCSQNEFFWKWWQEISSRITYISGRLSQGHAKKLRTLGCHEPSDHVFAAVAHRTGRYLVTEDSDMGAEVAVYLKSKLGLTVHDAKEACNHLSDSTS